MEKKRKKKLFSSLDEKLLRYFMGLGEKSKSEETTFPTFTPT
jgi:hypothetical protein